MSEQHKEVWFVTGANKGLGAAIAKEALDNGHRVVAAARRPEEVRAVLGDSPNVLVVRLDITSDEEVHAAVNAALGRFGRIDTWSTMPVMACSDTSRNARRCSSGNRLKQMSLAP